MVVSGPSSATPNGRAGGRVGGSMAVGEGAAGHKRVDPRTVGDPHEAERRPRAALQELGDGQPPEVLERQRAVHLGAVDAVAERGVGESGGTCLSHTHINTGGPASLPQQSARKNVPPPTPTPRWERFKRGESVEARWRMAWRAPRPWGVHHHQLEAPQLCHSLAQPVVVCRCVTRFGASQGSVTQPK